MHRLVLSKQAGRKGERGRGTKKEKREKEVREKGEEGRGGKRRGRRKKGLTATVLRTASNPGENGQNRTG